MLDFILGGGFMGYVSIAATVVMALAVCASAIAALTPTTADDKVAAFLHAVHDFLVKFVPSGATMAMKRAPVAMPPVVHSKRP